MSVINQQDVQNIGDAIDACPDCTQLLDLAEKQLEIWVKQMEDAIKAKASAQAKMTVPTNLGEVISWIETHCTEAATTYANTVTEIAEITAAFATITAKLTAKASALSCGTITIPTLPTP